MKKVLNILAKALSIVIVLFFAAFILEGFGPDFGWQDSVSHLIPTLIILAVLIFTWKNPNIGGWLFVALGIFLMFFMKEGLITYVVGGVPLLTGALFLISERMSSQK